MSSSLSPGDYAARSAAAYRRQLLEHLTEHGVPEGDPEAAGRHAAALTAAGQAWADDAGPFTDTAGARAALGGVSKQAVSQRLRDGRLLGLQLASDGTARDRIVYPVWQFRPGVLGALPAVLSAAGFDPDRPVSGWTIAAWLTTADEGLGGLAPVELLEAGHRDRVVAAAAEVRAALGVDEREAVAAAAVAAAS